MTNTEATGNRNPDVSFLNAKMALQRTEQSFGPDSPEMAMALANFALENRNQGRFEDAKQLYTRAISVWQKVPGFMNNTSFALTAYQLGELARLEKNLDLAEACFKLALDVFTRMKGSRDLGAVLSLNNLGLVEFARGQYALAEPRFRQALEISEASLAPDDPVLAIYLNNLGRDVEELGGQAEAESLYKRALAIEEKAYGTDSPKLEATRMNLASLYQAQGKMMSALLFAGLAAESKRKNSSGNGHDDAADLDKLAEALPGNAESGRSTHQTGASGPTMWSMPGCNARNSGQCQHDTSQNRGTLKWRVRTSGSVFAQAPAITSDGTLLLAQSDKVYALQPDGTPKWVHELQQASAETGPYACMDAHGVLYVADGVNLVAMNQDGTVKWTFEKVRAIGTTLSRPTVAPDGSIYLPPGIKLFGRPVLTALDSEGFIKWQYATEDVSWSSVVVAPDGTVYSETTDGWLHAVHSDGTPKWRFKTGSPAVGCSPAVSEDGTIYVGSEDHYVLALNPDGTLRWRYETNGRRVPSPTVATDGTVYAGSEDGRLYAIYPGGRLKWKFSTDADSLSSAVIGGDGTIYVGTCADRRLLAIHPDGILKWTYYAEGAVRCPPSIASDGILYLMTGDACLQALV